MASGSRPESTSQPGVADNIQPRGGASLVSRRRLVATVSRSDVYRWAVRNFILTNSVPAVTWQKQINNFLRVFFLQSRRRTWWCRTLQINCSFFSPLFLLCGKGRVPDNYQKRGHFGRGVGSMVCAAKKKGLISSVVLESPLLGFKNAPEFAKKMLWFTFTEMQHLITLSGPSVQANWCFIVLVLGCVWHRERGLPFGRHSGFVDL